MLARVTKIFPNENFFPTKFSPISHISPLWKFWINSARRQKDPSISFSAVTPTNVWIRPQKFLTYSFNLFTTNYQAIPSASSKLLNLNQEHPSKKLVFLVKSQYHWDYDNFCHKNATVTKFWSCDHIYNMIWVTW